MSEQTPSPENSRKAFVIKVTQNPSEVLSSEANLSKGCGAAIDFLRKVRAEIKSDESYNIEGPDADYKNFHIYGNARLEHYEGLFGILKRSGYSQSEIQSALMDSLPHASGGVGQGEQVRKFIKITEEALNNVYATK